MTSFLLAIQFLTQIPVRSSSRVTPRQIAASYYFYPVVAILIGFLAVGFRRVLAFVFPIPFVIITLLAFLTWFSGGLHEDGLADTADAMAGGWDRERRLEIMKDSRIGAAGAAALIFALLGKYAALTSMNPGRLDIAIFVAQVLARWSFFPMAFFNEPAQSGLGSGFTKALTFKAAIAASVLSTAAIIIAAGTRGALALLAAGLVTTVASQYFRRRLGGVTGDCFGATYQFVEIATYAVFLA